MIDKPVALAETLRALMDEQGLSENELARRIPGVYQATIHRILSGATPDPRLSTLVALSKYFHVSIEALIGEPPVATVEEAYIAIAAMSPDEQGRLFARIAQALVSDK